MSKLSERLRERALDYAALGFHVFALQAQGKKPRKDTHGLSDATTDAETILQWWEDFPEANVGINCGASGLVVLDIDVKDGKDARPAIEGKDLSGAVCVRTPTGGFHYYWRAGGEAFQSGADLYGVNGLDVRAVGGYVVAPPSCVILAEGERAKPYKVISGDFARIGTVPQWLVEWERKRQADTAAKSAAVASGGGEVVPKEADAALVARARAYLAAMPAAISGQGGHVATLKAAVALVVGFLLNDADALAIMREDYNPRCVPPWSRKELQHKVAEARKNARGKRPGYLLTHGLPLTNYTLERVASDDGQEKTVARPRQISDICAEIEQRFDGFPKRLGSVLFDFDAEAGQVLELPTPEAFSAWLQRRGNCLVDFKGKSGFTRWREVYENLLQTAEAFDAVARAPFWPERRTSRTFALYGKLPQATGGSSAFWKLLDFMSPATAEDRLLMAAFFIAPMFFSEAGDIARPGWAIDTTDGQGAGKTSVVETCAKTYDCVPIALDFASLDARQGEVKKRLISTEGRATRIALFDNVTRTVKSATLAELITSSHITERKAYGRGEESRPNDLTFCLTFNGGKFDTDGAVRFYPVKVKEPEAKVAFWKRRVFEYIDTNRPQLFADIIAMLEAAQRRIDAGEIWTRSKSRFPEFDALVLGAVCKDRGEFDALDAYMAGTMSEANDDADKAAAVETAITNAMQRCPGWDAAMPTVLFAGDIDALMDTNAELARLRVRSRDLRAWIQSGLLPRWSKDFRRLENNRDKPGWRAASFLFGLDLFSDDAPTTDVQVVKADWGRRDGQTSGTIAGYTKLRGRWR